MRKRAKPEPHAAFTPEPKTETAAGLRSLLKSKEQEVAELRAQIANLVADLDAARQNAASAEAARLRAELNAVHRAPAAITKKNTALQAELDAAGAREAALVKALAEAVRTIDQAAQQLHTAGAETEILKEQLAFAKEQFNTAARERDEARQQLASNPLAPKEGRAFSDPER